MQPLNYTNDQHTACSDRFPTDNQCLSVDGVNRAITVGTSSDHLIHADLFLRLDWNPSFVSHLSRERTAGALCPVILGCMGDTKFSREDLFQSDANLGGY